MNAGKTLFAQVMGFVPWTSFARIVQRHSGNAGVRALTCTEQFRAMTFAQLTWRESLRSCKVRSTIAELRGQSCRVRSTVVAPPAVDIEALDSLAIVWTAADSLKWRDWCHGYKMLLVERLFMPYNDVR